MDNKVFNNILVITTEGCDACTIAINNVKNAMEQSSKEISLDIKDFKEVKKDKIIKNYIKDFPTVIYFKNDAVVQISAGTHPASVYLRWIDIWFE